MRKKYITILIVLIVGILAILLFQTVIKKSQDNRSGAPDEIPPGAVQFSLDDKNNSGLGGLGTYQDVGGKAVIDFTLLAQDPISGVHNAQIRNGTCGEPGESIYQLSDAVDGKSSTTLETSLETLKGQFPLIVTVSSPQDPSSYVACGYLDHPAP